MTVNNNQRLELFLNKTSLHDGANSYIHTMVAKK
jgi:hypothetical protein